MTRCTEPGDGREAEDGFTLAEMLVVIVILGIIFAALTASVILGLRTTKDSDARVTQSNSAQFTSVYFTRDVQSAEDVLLPGDSDWASYSCGSDAGAVLKLVSPEADRVVTYAVTNGDPLDPPDLVRRRCDPIGATPQQVTVARRLAAGAGAVTATCLPDAGTCTAVELHVASESGPSDPTGLQFDLTVSRRPTT